MTPTKITYKAGRRTIQIERFHQSADDARAWFNREADALAIGHGVARVTLVSIA